MQTARLPMTRWTVDAVVRIHTLAVNGAVPGLSAAVLLTVTRSFTPSNESPWPNRPPVRNTPFCKVPGLSSPALSTAVVPLASSNPNAAMRVAGPAVVLNVTSFEELSLRLASREITR